MTEPLASLLAVAQNSLLTAFLVFLRIGAVMAVLPAFGERSVPERVRLVLAIGFTAIVFPAVSEGLAPLAASQEKVAAALLTEVISGLILGLSLRLFVMVLQIAGALIAQSTSLSQIFGGGAVEAQPAIAHLLSVAGLALAVMMGLHVRVAELLILSYDVFPAGFMAPARDVMIWSVDHVGRIFALSFTLAAPFIIASLVYNVALGVINRAMPQLMVAFVGAPAITLGGLLLLFVSAPLLLETWEAGFARLLLDPFGAR
ncbi:flagellar biosynthetic protein FliR [Celeribacter indicus]|uniref:Flagellar biosynthetic protein FliR n=1 Tax=Celeribacter indicus TaxID=1208324 RepID=A0A0B5DNP2_9RHOB|nr:flagellar biosynthetic protein FliR [Celeribacter indicus]AJE44819.1 flagellar biosynthetic protein FliR [Celeribacter indicus]SDX24300.1 flagellar biosynthetic protein FliR [Celeribacter indicus]